MLFLLRTGTDVDLSGFEKQVIHPPPVISANESYKAKNDGCKPALCDPAI